MALNRLRFHNILVQDMDAPSVAATELAETVDEGITDATSGLATKQDLEHQRLELTAEMQRMLHTQLRWIIAMWGSVLAAIIGLMIVVILRGG